MSILRPDLSKFFFICLAFCVQGYKSVGSKEKRHKTVPEKVKLFQSVGCKYSNCLRTLNSAVLDVQVNETDFYKDNKQKLDDYAKKYSKLIELKKSAQMYLKFISEQVGYGIYAGKDIKAGDFIGEYTGVLRPVKKNGDNLDYAWYYTLDNLDDEKFVVDGKDEGNELRFINHASDPNAHRIDVVGEDGIFHVCYIATKDIKKDQQLTVSYGEGYWSSRGIAPENFA